MSNCTKAEVYVVWGGSYDIIHYEFDTQPELRAFLRGFAVGAKNLLYDLFPSEQEAKAYIEDRSAFSC